MNETRRGFLGLLAKVPIAIGAFFAWYGRVFEIGADAATLDPIEEKILDDFERGLFDKQASDELGYRLIRWIPVTERPAPLGEIVMMAFGALPVSAGPDIPPIAFARPLLISEKIRWTMPSDPSACIPESFVVTHWAECPAPPSEPSLDSMRGAFSDAFGIAPPQGDEAMRTIHRDLLT